MKCGKCKFKNNIGNTEETGAALCSRVPSYFPINCKDDCHFLPRKKELYCKDCSRLGRDTACMTARENDKVYNNGQRCGGFIDKKKMNSQRFYCSGNHRGGMSAPKSIGC